MLKFVVENSNRWRCLMEGKLFVISGASSIHAESLLPTVSQCVFFLNLFHGQITQTNIDHLSSQEEIKFCLQNLSQNVQDLLCTSIWETFFLQKFENWHLSFLSLMLAQESLVSGHLRPLLLKNCRNFADRISFLPESSGPTRSRSCLDFVE